MKTAITIIALIVIIGAIILGTKKHNVSNQVSTIVGCYQANLGKDVYKLTIDSENNGEVAGSLSFKNYQKDSSSGSFVGTYANEMLVGDYEFDSEGMHSIRQVAFKKVDTGFQEGFGDVAMEGNRESLKDLSNLSYDTSFTFVKGACTE